MVGRSSGAGRPAAQQSPKAVVAFCRPVRGPQRLETVVSTSVCGRYQITSSHKLADRLGVRKEHISSYLRFYRRLSVCGPYEGV